MRMIVHIWLSSASLFLWQQSVRHETVQLEAHMVGMLHAVHEDMPYVPQEFPIPEAKLIQLAQELFAKEAGVTDDSLLSDDFRRAQICVAILVHLAAGVASTLLNHH